MNDDETLVICARVNQLPDPVKGSMVEKCLDCHEEVWISPNAVFAAGATSKAVCIPCAMKRMEKTKEPVKIMPLSDAQVKEMKEHMQ